MCLLISSVVTLTLTLLQSFNFLSKMRIKFYFPLTKKNIFLLLIGLVIYAIYLYVPFYLNILSYFFKEQSLWIVQLSPALTAVSSVFVVYYMDPKVAKFIDATKNKKNPINAYKKFIIINIREKTSTFLSTFSSSTLNLTILVFITELKYGGILPIDPKLLSALISAILPSDEP